MPNPLDSISRRSALTLLGGVGATAALPAVGRAEPRLADVSPSWFRDRVGEPFTLRPTAQDGGETIEVVLESVVEGERVARRVAPFTLLFREKGGQSISDACYTISHQRFRIAGVFVSRVLGDDQAQNHEVIFG